MNAGRNNKVLVIVVCFYVFLYAIYVFTLLRERATDLLLHSRNAYDSQAEGGTQELHPGLAHSSRSKLLEPSESCSSLSA